MNTQKKRIMYTSIIAGVFLLAALSVFAYVFWSHNQENSSKKEGSFSGGGGVSMEDNSRNKVVFRHYHASDETFSIEDIYLPFADSIAIQASPILGGNYSHEFDIGKLPNYTYWEAQLREVLNPGKPNPENPWVPFTSLPIGRSFSLSTLLESGSARRTLASAIFPPSITDDITLVMPTPIPEPEIAITLLIGGLNVVTVTRRRKTRSSDDNSTFK